MAKDGAFGAQVEPPHDLQEALAATPAAQDAWKGLTEIGQRDFINWINEAKQAETRGKRILRCCENLLKGKRRPCCYSVVPMDLYKEFANNPAAKAQWSKLSANEKRDLTEWVDSARGKQERKLTIQEVCSLLAEGRHSR